MSLNPGDTLVSRMQKDWDRRVEHDYRYWMSDGVDSDQAMWEVGERDLGLLLSDLNPSQNKSQIALELGCGVGRLLRAASKRFAHVIGVDVSLAALEKAANLLEDLENIELWQTEDCSLGAVPRNSIDCAYSFAVIGSLPVRVFAAYLLEINRVLKAGGNACLQVYLGKAQEQLAEEDTLSLRSYEPENFARALELLGWSLEQSKELILPFEVSDHQQGVVAYLTKATKVYTKEPALEDLLQTLCPQGEQSRGQDFQGSETEYLMAITRAKQHLERREFELAERSLKFALSCYQGMDAEVKELFKQLERESSFTARNTSASTQQVTLAYSRFPHLQEELAALSPSSCCEIRAWGEKAVMFFKGEPLIHPDKPVRAAEIWTEQTLNISRIREAREILVFGFANGSHLRELLRQTTQPVHVYEPNREILKTALEGLEVADVLEKISSLHTSLASLKTELAPMLGAGALELAIYPQTQLIAPDELAQLKHALLASRGLSLLKPRIAVVGPMYGGSLPIARYSARALLGLKTRSYGLDLSPFFESFKNIGGFIRNQNKKDSLESQYVELLSSAILEGINERPIDILICLAQAPVSPRLLNELRSRGIITVMWFVEDCRRFHTWKAIAPFFDYMFLIQNGQWLKDVEAAGASRAVYLPVGCDPDLHRPLNLTAEEKARYGSDISFLGAGYNNRRHMFAYLANRNFKIWGTEWPNCMPFSKLLQEAGRRLEPEEYIKIFNASAVNLNLHSSMERDGVEPFGDFVNPRTFELASCGAFQLVDERTHLKEMFTPGVELATFTNAQEMQEKIDYYLARPAERLEMTLRARERALSEHTYQHRLKQMLEIIYAERFEQLKARENSGPWHVTLNAAAEHPELAQHLQKVFERGDDPTFDAIISDISSGKGALNEMEQKLLFLSHLRSQITHTKLTRNEKD